MKLFVLSSSNKDFSNSWLKSESVIIEARDFCLRRADSKLIYFFSYDLSVLFLLLFYTIQNSNCIKLYFKNWLYELLELFSSKYNPKLFQLLSILLLFNYDRATANLFSNYNESDYNLLLNISLKMLPATLPPLLIEVYPKLDQVISKLKLVLNSTKICSDTLIKNIRRTTRRIVDILESKSK